MNRSTVSSSPLFRKVHEKLKSPNIKRISNLLTLQKAFTNSNSLQIDNSLIYKDEIEELQESKLKEVKIQRNFALTEDNLKMSNIMQGLKIVKKLMSTQAVETNFPELKSVKTIILNNSLISDHSVSDNESEFDRSQKKLRSDSDNENEERKSSRFLSRKNLSSVNLNLEQTKASVFRRSKQLTVKTIVGIPSNSNLRTHKKHSTLINNDSPIVISPVKRKNLNEFAKPIKKNYKNSIQTRRISKIIEPSTFLGAQFKESEIKEVRPYHKIGLEINNPEMLKNKNFMHKAFTNDLTLNKTTFFSRKLKDKMNRQLLNDNEEESEDMKSRGWIRCGFNSKNSCKCKIF